MNSISEIKYKTSEYLSKTVINLISNLSDENLERLMFIVEKATPKTHKSIASTVRRLFKEGHPSLILAKNFIRNTDINCRNKFVNNLILNGLILNQKKRNKFLENQGLYVPTTILISPTMRCNFKCKGCYANDYKQTEDLSFEVVDRIVKEGNELGVGFYTILGGEPFVWKDLFKLFEKHRDTYFQVYTNGSLINEDIANKLIKLGNVMLMFSLEGFSEKTNNRRGKGTYEKVIRAMDLLKSKKIPFGYSVFVTRENVEEVMSGEFIDMLIERGAYIGWYFMCMPIGKKPDLKLMPTPKQRVNMLKRDNEIRATKSLFIVDFWNDAPFVKGCIAAKCYIHINSNGDVEPCIFTHFAQDNIKEKSLKEVLQSDFFKAIRKRQPYNKNLFLPCMLVDNPEVFREINKEVKIRPTHPGADSLINKLKPGIDKYSKEVKKLYKPIWEDFKSKRDSK